MKALENYIKKHNIKIISAQFLDLYNNLRVINIPASRITDVIKYGLKCDGSSINREREITNSDIRLFLDCDSYYLLPNGNLAIFCDMDTRYDARKKLKHLQKQLSKKYSPFFGAEIEFFLFKTINGLPDFKNLEKERYCGEITDNFNNVLNEVVNFANENNFCIEACHREGGTNQFEINFKYDTPLKTADKVVVLKQIIRYFAKKHEMVACFMPKPLNNTAGSGMHINMSVFNNDTNLFYSENDKNKLSTFAYNFIDNLLKHSSAISAFANSTTNSYKRLNSGFETPNKVVCSTSDRSALIRIPKATKKTTRIELRSPDIACNPYLTFCAVLLAGFEKEFAGKETNLVAPLTLPYNLKDALEFLQQDDLLNNLVPNQYISSKLNEFYSAERYVNNYDISTYFNI